MRHDDAGLDREELALLFARMSDRYRLTRMELHSDDGATFSGDEGVEVVLRSGQTTSCSVTGLGFREGVERVAGAAAEVLERHGVGPLLLEDVTLVATWDCGDDDCARRLLAAEILRVDDERMDLLGGDEVSMGLRVWRRAGESSTDCAIEPMHAEPSKLYLRLVHTQGPPLADLSELHEVVEAVHDVLQGPFKSFLLARATR